MCQRVRIFRECSQSLKRRSQVDRRKVFMAKPIYRSLAGTICN